MKPPLHPIREFLAPPKLPSSVYSENTNQVSRDRYFEVTIGELQRLSRLPKPIEAVAFESERILSQPWAIATSVPRISTSLEQEFKRLRKLWREETSGISSVTRILLNHHYLRIISLGPRVLPLILAELSQKPDHWFMALAVLSDSDPTEPGFTFTQATEAWLKWGREHGYLAN